MRLNLTGPSPFTVQPEVWRWPHIHPSKEWACKGTGEIVIETEFLDKVERLRAIVGWPLMITSGYRSPAHNAAVSTTGEHGPHTTARAVDIRIYGERALILIENALTLGFTGIGVKQHGLRLGRFVHLDDLGELPDRPRPWLWSY